MTELSDRGKAFRTAITAFIEARRETKLKGKEDDADTASKYDYATWLADAASRAHHLQVATHPIKFTHSAIKGSSSVHVGWSNRFEHSEIGTHSLAYPKEDFAISDSKHLDVYSFLKEEFDGKPFLDWLREGNTDFLDALDDDREKSEALATSFKRVLRQDNSITSHSLAKQIYWLNGENPEKDIQYHLLQPMFSSSLEHVVHADISTAREAFFAARGTKKQKPTFADHSAYPILLGRTLGGSNAQNVSPQNKVRGGVNYLLPSLPPKWDQDRFRQLLNIETSLDRFAHFKGVRFLVKTLADFLRSNPDRNMDTRDRREAIEQALGLQLPVFAASIQANSEPGWTRNPDCALPPCEQLWLDPERIELPLRTGHEQEDEDFIAAYHRGDWQDEVASRFANWVNAQLREASLPTVGDAEYKHWARQAIIDAAWPVPMQRRAPAGSEA